MVKLLLLVTSLANIFFLVSSTGQPSTSPCKPPEPICCRANEIYSDCPIAVCRPKNCSDVGFPIPCPDLRPDGKCPVEPGCICQEGYVRNFGGICIPMKHCSSCGGDPNAESSSGTSSNRLCSNYNKKPCEQEQCRQSCTYNCCQCRLGFVFDEIKRKCVFPSQCTRMNCTKKNEIYDPCPSPSQYHTCGINDAVSCDLALCPGDPECSPPKCRCRDGYYRNDVGKCVLWEQCPVCKGLNEMYDPCIPPCPIQSCDVNIALILCAVPPKLGDPECQAGCRCIDDHVRNRTGVCIPRDQCPTCPNQNEEFDLCIAPCPKRQCDEDDRTIRCAAPPELGDPSCVSGCRCSDGFYRNGLGLCVTRAECPSCYGPNEHYACGGACDNICKSLHIQNQTNCLIRNIRCNDMCYCDEGFARDEYNICIPIKDCKVPKCKGQHEVYSECTQGDCRPKNCSQLGMSIPCPRIDPKFCKKGCLCEDGYVRNKNGVCILIEQCPPVCKKNEVYTDCVNKPCPVQYCSQINTIVVCVEIDPKDCIEGCLCKSSYMRDDDGICVPISKCKTKTCSGKNEVYENCTNPSCFAKKCSELGFPLNCTDPPKCKKGCICREGHVRNSNGTCIPAKQCSSCGGDPNAETENCASNCGRLCSDYFKENVACTRECRLNGCQCRKGHVYDSNTMQCVIPKDCTPICKTNEVYSDCINGGCSAKNCSQVGLEVPCVKLNPKYCIKGCLCKEGYLREDNGQCVPAKDCKPKTCSSENEVFDNCSNPSCLAKKCSEVGFPLNCTNPPTCNRGCTCIEGYLRNCKGKCIPMKQCPACGGDQNAEPEYCASNCGRLCSDYFKENVVCTLICRLNGCQCRKGHVYDSNTMQCVLPKDCTPICKTNEVYSDCINGGCSAKNCSQVGLEVPCVKLNPKYCIKGCLCKEGYLREDNGQCVPAKDCKPKTCSGENEVFDNCSNPSCLAKKCSEVGFPLNCTNPPTCNRGCTCIEGYLRNCKGKCIPMKQCPACGGDQNAEPEYCASNCGRLCSDYFKENVACPLICRLNGCQCRKGHVYDSNTMQCVLPKDCTPICKTNEVYSDCINGGCSAKNCSQVGLEVPCVKLNPKYCIKGCLCKEGYLREDNGQCVPAKDCKPKTCSGKNEVYENCTNPSCFAKKCSELGFPLNCTDPPKCNKGCICREGHVRSSNGTCIPAKQCSSCGGDPNAETEYCASNCGRLCSDYFKKDVVCTLECRLNGCQCRKGYVYDSIRMQCVLPKDCTKICSGKNEVYENCTNPRCVPKKCSEVGFSLNCTDPPKCKKECICKEGYVRDSKGICIPIKKCPCKGDKNAESGCGVNCLKKCYDLQNPDNPRRCTKICKVNSCDCREGFYYDENTDTCVHPDECTPSCKENEEYNSCVNGGCGYRNCSEINGPILCIDPLECKGGCSCKKGYLRLDDTGVCVPEEKCPKICDKPNEKFVKCPPNCPPTQACENINKTFHCPLIKVKINESDCVGECRCIEGYYRNLIGECICEEDCLKCPKAHEYHSCGPECDNVCCDLDKQSKDNCPIKNKKCTPKCYCEDGYARNDDGDCVCIDECPERVSTTPKPTVNSTVALENFERGNTMVAIKLLNFMIESRPGENFMVSALSILIVLAQLTLNAIGVALEQLLQLLNFDNKDEIRVAMPILIDSFKGQNDVIFEMANKIYAAVDFPLTEQFESDAINIFDSSAENIDFNNGEVAAKSINDWVGSKTNGLINNLVSPDMFNSQTRVAFFNCLYFLGNWLHTFNPDNTEPKDFYLNDEDSIQLPTMFQRNTFEYGESEELDAQMVAIPYLGQQYKLFIYLPRQKTGLKSLVKNLTPDIFNMNIKSLKREKVDFSMPRMDFSTDISDLIDLLMKLNITAPFKSDSNQFEGIFQNNETLFISDAIQKTVFKANENGTEAAAATGIMVGTTAVIVNPKIYTFAWNRPGIFFLLFNNFIILCGTFSGATSN